MTAIETVPQVGQLYSWTPIVTSLPRRPCVVRVTAIKNGAVFSVCPSTGNRYVNTLEVFLASTGMV